MPIKKKINTVTLLFPEIKKLLSNKQFAQVKDLLKDIHPMDIAYRFKSFDDHEKMLLFKLLERDKSLDVFEGLSFDEQEFLLNNLDNKDIAVVLNEMAPDERVDLFQELSEEEVKKFFSMMRKEEVEDVKNLITYEEGTAGSLMTTEMVALLPNLSAKDAIIKLQEDFKKGASEHIYTNYVVDENSGLLGAVDIQKLIMSPPRMLVKDIMTGTEDIKVYAESDDNNVAERFMKYDLLSVPVVDKDNKLLGVIIHDDIVDLIQDENTREIYGLGKMHVEEGEEIRYSTSTSFTLFKRRAGWLIFLLILDFLTGTILKSYEHALSSVVALSFFIPMLLDTGGNAGGQVSFTIIRSLATGDVSPSNVWAIVKKEFISAAFMSVVVTVVAFLRAYLLQGDIMLATVVGATMGIIVLLAVSTGIFLPLASKKVGLDPAVLAGPVTTSIVDIVGLIIYFTIATKVLAIIK